MIPEMASPHSTLSLVGILTYTINGTPERIGDTILLILARPCMRALTLILLLFLMTCIVAAQHARHGYPTPPEPAQRSGEAVNSTGTQVVRTVDPLHLQREAREMLELSQSVQLDIDAVSHGLLPKELNDKLKRIEKLSKHLRSEIAPR
jgi:hypothetical protein